MRQVWASVVLLIVVCLGPRGAQAQQGTTAWDGTRYRFDLPGVVARSNLVLQRANRKPTEALPLGNGRLGVAVWAKDGMTVQLNRSDTMPRRLSPGQVSFPGLKVMTDAPDFHAELRLYDGKLVEQGGGITAVVWVDPQRDVLVVDVSGTDPRQEQTALLKLWAPRQPQAMVHGDRAWLQESWIDAREPGASGRAFGSLAVISARGSRVRAERVDERTVMVRAKPTSGGHVTFLVAAPHFQGGKADGAVQAALDGVAAGSQSACWHAFWARAGLIEVHSADGLGEYMENIRNLYLYVAAAEGKGDWPASQAGIADLISSAGDVHRWDPAAFWHWNLRMQVEANLSAGLPELNWPYFSLYAENLERIEGWTRERMAGRPGICVPETMRFNGKGIEYEVDFKTSAVTTGLNCDAGSKPYFNARTLSTGAEISLWAWQQYLATADRRFLERMYPFMKAATEFLLAYETEGGDGQRHTQPSNAHETQWDVVDPTTDLAARKTLYPVMMEAATTLGRDAALVRRLRDEVGEIPAFPLDEAGKQVPVRDAAGVAAGGAGAEGGADVAAKARGASSGVARTHGEGGAGAERGGGVIADSWQQEAPRHNVENVGLEPVWPYGLVGLGSAPAELERGRRTFWNRPFPTNQDWSYDPLQAARLGLPEEVAKTLRKLTETYQSFPNGMANWGGDSGEFYIEQSGVVAATLAEAVVQDYEGLVRVAPAVPGTWSMQARVAVRHGTRIDVEVEHGLPTSVVIEAGPGVHHVAVLNPWKGGGVEVWSGKRRVARLSGSMLQVAVVPGGSFLLKPAGQAMLPFAAVSGEAATTPRHLGRVSIGLGKL